MTEKVLGKITFAEYGTVRDHPFLMGLLLGFTMPCGDVMDGGKYTVNINPKCKWKSATDRAAAVVESAEFIYSILKDAKVNYVSELVGKPVEVELEHRTFKGFRILTEVL